MNYAEADAKLQGRCYSSRKLANNTYLKRCYNDAIAIRLHATDILMFHKDGSIEVCTGGWDTVTTRCRMASYLPKPWHVFGERGATILSNYRWYSGSDNKCERQGNCEVLVDRTATIHPDGTAEGGDVQAYRQAIRGEDNRRNRLRSKLRRYVKAAREHRIPAKLTIAKIQAEKNAQIRSAMIMAFGFDRYILQSNAETLQQDGEYTLLKLPLDNWTNMVALKCVCPSTGAAYVLPVDPRMNSIDSALDWMFDTTDYRKQLVAES
jgi:hypothetical protein